MALKLAAIFGGAPAGGPPWGWFGLKDMLDGSPNVVSSMGRVGISDFEGWARIKQALRGVDSCLHL